MEEGCKIEISGGREEGVRQRGEVERDVASVAAVIKLRTVGRSGSSASL